MRQVNELRSSSFVPFEEIKTHKKILHIINDFRTHLMVGPSKITFSIYFYKNEEDPYST